MPSFLTRRSSSETTSAQSQIKIRIRDRLSESVKKLQQIYGIDPLKVLLSNQKSNDLLSALEAIFIHGLKDSFLGKITSALGSSNSSERSGSSSGHPEPNFWLFLLIFSHREDIDKVNSLSQITTDVGRCRAWLRVSLNGGLLSSYLQSMARDKSSFRHHYNSFAFIRDQEHFDIALRLLKGLDVFTFDLAVNASILNNWQTTPLGIAGIVEESSISMALDAATALIPPLVISKPDPPSKTIDSAPLSVEETQVPNSSIKPLGMGILSRGLLNEEEALRLILQSSSPLYGSPANPSFFNVSQSTPRDKDLDDTSINEVFSTPPVTFTMSSSGSNTSSPKEETKAKEEELKDQKYLVDVQNGIEDECAAQNEVVVETEDEEEKSNDNCEEDNIREENELEEESKEIEETEMILRDNKAFDETSDEDCANLSQQQSVSQESSSKTPPTQSFTSTTDINSSDSEERILTPHLSGFIDAWAPFRRAKYFDTPPESHETVEYGFSLKSDLTIGGLSHTHSQFFMSCIDIIPREEGLDNQNWECNDCGKTLGSIFGPYRTCSYSKKYYCTDCHIDDLRSIPYKIVYNWDFGKYPICSKAKMFLDSIRLEPIINVQSFNCGLFSYSRDLDDIFTLRKKLNYQYQYLKACAKTASTWNEIQKQLEFKEYLITDVDIYSLADLEQVNNGSLAVRLKSALALASSHIYKCVICKGHGFICEICRAIKPLYPFELERISQCDKCFTVFHKECSETLTTCPKCERLESRNLNWHVSNIVMKNVKL